MKRFNATDGINLTFYFSDKTSSGVLDIRADGTIKRTYQHNDGGGASGSENFTFTITPTNGPGSQMLSVTRAEMLAALDSGKTLLGYWTETKTILENTDAIKHEFRLESVSGTGASRGLAFVNYEQFYKSTLYVNGNDTVSFVDKEVLPAPMTKTEAMTQSVGMDDDGRLWTEPGADGITPHIGENGNWYLGDTDTGKPSRGAGIDITGATIGQIAKITAVDDTGKPTSWSPVDMPTGGGSGSVAVDSTLTVSGQAADAKATGDAIRSLSDEITDLEKKASFTTDKSLTLKDGVLSVNTTDNAEKDNTLPISSAGVYTHIGNIEVLLKTI